MRIFLSTGAFGKYVKSQFDFDWDGQIKMLWPLNVQKIKMIPLQILHFEFRRLNCKIWIKTTMIYFSIKHSSLRY